MPSSEAIAAIIIVVLTLFTTFTGLRSLATGKLAFVPGEITRKEKFHLWVAGVAVQLITAGALILFCVQLFKAPAAV